MRALLAVVVAGCYSPTLIDGQICSETAHCPEGLSCDPNTNTCVSQVVHCTEWSDFATPATLVNLRVSGTSLNGPWLSPDLRELWYLEEGASPSLHRARRQQGGEFLAGEPIAQPDDIDGANGQPFLSDDLLTIYYNDSGLHSWQRTRETTMDEFSLTGARVFPNMPGSDPALTADGLEIVVAVTVLPTAADLELSTRASVADPLPPPSADVFGAANSPTDDDCCASISGDGTEVIFESSRGRQALWRTTRASRSDAFGPAEKLTGQPAAADNASPTLSRDGTTLVFASKPDGQVGSDLVIAERTCLQSD